MTNYSGNIYSRLGVVSLLADIFDPPIDVTRAIKRTIVSRNNTDQSIRLTSSNTNSLTNELVKCHDELFYAKTVFPFVLFSNIVKLDREKVTVINRSFFYSAKIISIPIRDLLNVEADVGPFFGSVHMSSRYFATTPCSLYYLKRGDALRLQRLLQGYIICEEKKIDCTNIDKDKLIVLLNDLGQGDVKYV